MASARIGLAYTGARPIFTFEGHRRGQFQARL
jgi:hypothetical protein